MIDPPTDQLKRLSEKLKDSSEKIDEFQYKAASERSQFFEKLALLDGGAIVLSVTFIGYFLSAQGTLRGRRLLYGSWSLLLLSLLACLLRNFFYQNYLYYSRVPSYIQQLSEQKELEAKVAIDPTQLFLSEEGRPLTAKEREDFAAELKTKAHNYRTEAKAAVGRGKRAERVWRPCEPAALIALFCGLTLLVSFAILNTHHH